MNTPAQVAKVFGCTVEQARAQMKANAAQLRALRIRAESTGRKVNGYTAAQLAERAAKMEAAAA